MKKIRIRFWFKYPVVNMRTRQTEICIAEDDIPIVIIEDFIIPEDIRQIRRLIPMIHHRMEVSVMIQLVIIQRIHIVHIHQR